MCNTWITQQCSKARSSLGTQRQASCYFVCSSYAFKPPSIFVLQKATFWRITHCLTSRVGVVHCRSVKLTAIANTVTLSLEVYSYQSPKVKCCLGLGFQKSWTAKVENEATSELKKMRTVFLVPRSAGTLSGLVCVPRQCLPTTIGDRIGPCCLHSHLVEFPKAPHRWSMRCIINCYRHA